MCKRLVSFFVVVLLAACASTERTVTVRLKENLVHGEVRQPAPTALSDAIVFGFDRRLEPKEDVRIYAPLLLYLEQKTGYHFTLHITPKDRNLVDEIGAGSVDFAAVGTLTYLQGQEQYDARMLVRGLNVKGQSVYRAAIVTRVDNSIASLADLSGRSFAFGSSTSTQGYLIPRLMLERAGVTVDDLRTYEFSGSHAETANAVISGRADAGGLQDTLAQALANQGLLRIVAWSDSYPSSGILVGAHVRSEVVEAVNAALLAFDPAGRDSAGLYHWERTEMPNGFTPTNDADYADLRHWAEQYGLLTP